jgi:hypothetical protein
MSDAFNVNKFFVFLKSFWGLLAAFSVSLPTLIYFLSTKQIQSSIIGEYYLGLPTSLALLTIPFVFLYEDKLFDISVARRISIILISSSIFLFFSFLVTKNIFVLDKVYKPINENGQITYIHSSRQGEILIEIYSEYDPRKPYRNELDNKINIQPDAISKEKRVSYFELLSLALFTSTIILLTASFSTLGVFYYSRHRGNLPLQ